MTNKEVSIFALQLFLIYLLIQFIAVIVPAISMQTGILIGDVGDETLLLILFFIAEFLLVAVTVWLILLFIKRIIKKILSNEFKTTLSDLPKDFDSKIISLIGLYYFITGILDFIYTVNYYTDESYIIYLSSLGEFILGLVLIVFSLKIASFLAGFRTKSE